MRTCARARTKKMPAPIVYIKTATRTLNNTIPQPQHRNTEAKHVAENRNPKKSVMILKHNVNGKIMEARGDIYVNAPINFRILAQCFEKLGESEVVEAKWLLLTKIKFIL